MKKVFITGASGFLGRHLIKFAPRQMEILAQYRTKPLENLPRSASLIKMDFIEDNWKTVEEFHPDIIVHISAMASLDDCELHPELAWKINYEATKSLVQIAQKCGSRFIFTSSDVIFDGEQGDYREEDEPQPINIYGKTKVAAENFIKSEMANFVIIRPSLIYGLSLNGRPSFTELMYRNLKAGKRVFLFTDQYRTPVLINNLADAYWELAGNDYSGILHVGGTQKTSRFEMGKILCELFSFPVDLLIPIKSREANQPAPRPADCSLNISRARKILKTNFVDCKQGISLTFQ